MCVCVCVCACVCVRVCVLVISGILHGEYNYVNSVLSSGLGAFFVDNKDVGTCHPPMFWDEIK